jgi:hypothetical protein
MFSSSFSYQIPNLFMGSRDSSEKGKDEKDSAIQGYNYSCELSTTFPFFKQSLSEVKVGD